MSSVFGAEQAFIVDNSASDRKVVHHVAEWCIPGASLDIATGTFEIGGLLALGEHWPRTSAIRILMGDQVSLRTKTHLDRAIARLTSELDQSLEEEKKQNAFLDGVDAIVQALATRKISCRVYTKDKFHAKAYIARAGGEAVAMAGSSNLTVPGLTENVELNTRHVGPQAAALDDWFNAHWEQGTDITEILLRTIERHVQLFTPFDVYAKSLYELLRDAGPSDETWDETQSRMFKVLDGYQVDGYRNFLHIAGNYGGALLCDGVGLGKTFVGLMLIERLIVREGRNVILLAPKAAVESVWKPSLARYLPRMGGGAFSNLFIASHTDLGLPKMREVFDAARQGAHVIVIDEAHHFRNPGSAGTGVGFLDAPKAALDPVLFPEARRSRYRELYDLIPSPDGSRKRVYMLTATPINNSFHDLRHMIELFTQKDEEHFARLGIHSTTAHFKKMEAQLDGASSAPRVLDSEKAESIMAADPLVSALVVQRSRSFVKEKQRRDGAPVTAFPPREPPHRADYSLQKVYGNLLKILEKAFDKTTPLFTLPMYYPLAYYKLPSELIDPGDENRQKQVVALIRTAFLKRFESSVEAFRSSCDRLLVKLLGWTATNVETAAEKESLNDWRRLHVKLVDDVKKRQPHLFRSDAAGDGDDNDESDEDVAEDEFAQSYDHLERDEYDVAKMLRESEQDLNQLVDFYAELDKFDHRNDDKLKKLLRMLKEDAAMSSGKLLVFTEFADTADYLLARLTAAGLTDVERIDSRTTGRDRLRVIKRFSPYYNNTTSADLAAAGLKEIRVLISTDVLSEGLNLQDASRLINYDLHWNPVRLMQRIGRVDRRRNPELEEKLAADHPASVDLRKNVAFYNFLPPAELNRLLTLYTKVTRKTLRISRALGIEGKKLLKEDDDYQDLQHFNETYEGTLSDMERLESERDMLLLAHPELKQRLENLPLRIFSGRAHPAAGSQAIFFCYALPGAAGTAPSAAADEPIEWTEEAGEVRWYLYDLAASAVSDSAPAIAQIIRSKPSTPRKLVLSRETLGDVRAKVEKHIKNTYFKAAGAPANMKPILKAWMELN